MTTTNDQRTLAVRMSEGRIPVQEALHYAMSLAEGLRKLHDAGKSHGAVSPSSVGLTANSVELIPSDGPSATVTPYTAPEVVQGQPADARSDVFSFGALVFEMLTGHRAFDGANEAELKVALCESAPPPSGSPAVDRLVSSCVAKSPQARWQRMQKIIMELKLLTVAVRRAEAAPAARGVTDTALRSELQQLEGRLSARLAVYERNTSAVQQAAGEAVESLRDQLGVVRAQVVALQERPIPPVLDVEALTQQIHGRVEQTLAAVTQQLHTQVQETVAAANQQHTAEMQDKFGAAHREIASHVKEVVDTASQQHGVQLQETIAQAQKIQAQVQDSVAAANQQHSAEMQGKFGAAHQEIAAHVKEMVDAASQRHAEQLQETVAQAQQLHTQAQDTVTAANRQHSAEIQEVLGAVSQGLTTQVKEIVDTASQQHAAQLQETIGRAEQLHAQAQDTVAAANRQHAAEMQEKLGSASQELAARFQETVDAAIRQHAAQVQETIGRVEARTEQQVGSSNEAVAAVNQRIAASELSMEEIRKHFARLQADVAADLHDFETSLKTQSAAIDSARTAMGQTDDLVERVVEALELLQSSLLDQHETASIN